MNPKARNLLLLFLLSIAFEVVSSSHPDCPTQQRQETVEQKTTISRMIKTIPPNLMIVVSLSTFLIATYLCFNSKNTNKKVTPEQKPLSGTKTLILDNQEVTVVERRFLTINHISQTENLSNMHIKDKDIRINIPIRPGKGCHILPEDIVAQYKENHGGRSKEYVLARIDYNSKSKETYCTYVKQVEPIPLSEMEDEYYSGALIERSAWEAIACNPKNNARRLCHPRTPTGKVIHHGPLLYNSQLKNNVIVAGIILDIARKKLHSHYKCALTNSGALDKYRGLNKNYLGIEHDHCLTLHYHATVPVDILSEGKCAIFLLQK